MNDRNISGKQQTKVIPQKPTDRIHKIMAIKGQCPRTPPPPIPNKTLAGYFQTYINKPVKMVEGKAIP